MQQNNFFFFPKIAQKSTGNESFIWPWLNHQETCTKMSLRCANHCWYCTCEHTDKHLCGAVLVLFKLVYLLLTMTKI